MAENKKPAIGEEIDISSINKVPAIGEETYLSELGAPVPEGFKPGAVESQVNPLQRALLSLAQKAAAATDIPTDAARQALFRTLGAQKESDRSFPTLSPTTSDEYLQRLGVPKTVKADFVPEFGEYGGKIAETTPVDVPFSAPLGLATDVGLDLITTKGLSTARKLLGLGKSGWAQLGSLLRNPLSSMSESGEMLYRLPFKEADLIATDAGRKYLPSTLALEEGLRGGSVVSRNRNADAVTELLATRKKDFFDPTTGSGVRTNIREAFSPLKQKYTDWKSPYSLAKEANNPYTQKAADRALSIMDEIEKAAAPEAFIPAAFTLERNPVMRPKTIDEIVKEGTKISKAKTEGKAFKYRLPEQGADLSTGLVFTQDFKPPKIDVTKMNETVGTNWKPAKPYKPGATAEQLSGVKTGLYQEIGDPAYDAFIRTPEGKAVQKEIANATKQEVERAVERAIPGGGGKLSDLNEKLATRLGVMDVLDREALKEARKRGLTEVDAILAGINPTALATKQGGRIFKSPLFQTNAGYGMYKLGNPIRGQSIWDSLLREGLLQGDNQ